MQKINLQEMEHTWGDNIKVLHSLAPLRDKMDERDKVSYKLLDSVKSDGVVRQVYFREGGGRDMDTVMVLNWRAGKAEKEGEVGT